MLGLLSKKTKKVAVMNGPLGIIPTWQFSSDANVNPSLNRFVPSSPAWQAASGMNGGGLGYVMVEANRSTLGPTQLEQLRTSGQIDGVFDTFRAGGWIYENQKWLWIGGAALLAFGVWRSL